MVTQSSANGEPALRILIADDEDVIRELSVATLEGDPRFILLEARNGEEALELAARERPDMAILDIRMPRTDGIATCAALRTAAATSAIPVLILTALNQRSDVERARAAGATDYFVKPFVPSELLTKVYDLLESVAA